MTAKLHWACIPSPAALKKQLRQIEVVVGTTRKYGR